jgi:hypothetical protein
VEEPQHSPKFVVPSAEADRPKLGQIGAIAVVCFLIGVLWPTLAGVRLVPEPPTKSKAAEEGAEEEKAVPKPKRGPDEGPPREVPAMQLAPLAAATAEVPLVIQESMVVNCRDAADHRLNQCDKPGFDSVANDRLRALTACEAAGTPNGILSIGFDLDFDKKKIRRLLRGKSTTLDDSKADALLECAKQEFMSATLEGVTHSHPYYLVFYTVRFNPPGVPAGAGETADPVIETSGSATVIWNSARLRATPEDGEVKATVVYGTKVIVTGRQGDWYRVKYDPKGSEGWVHKNALAL